ncbi:MAG: HAMP domain-containing sensor histidine kinase [Pseudomonadota bacterium]
MNPALPALFRTTTFRLVVVNAFLFMAFTIGLLAYLYSATFGYLSARANNEITAEIQALEAAYVTGGLARLNQSVLERASVPGSRRYFYVLLDRTGRRIYGDFGGFPQFEEPPASVNDPVVFTYGVATPDGETRERVAEGRVARLPDGGVLLVAFDRQEVSDLGPVVARAVITAAPIGLLLSLIGGGVIARTASRRAEALATTTAEVMAGDLSRRAPVNGSGDEFDRLSVRLNAMLERVEKLMMAARHTGDAIAHDLRSPLSRLRNRLETALSEPMDTADAQETIGQTLEEVDHVLATFNAILRLSRLEAGEGGRLVRLDVSDIAQEMGELFGPACEAADLGWSANLTKGLQVLGDRDLLAQAISNLLDNAVKYTPAGGAIVFEARRGREGDVVVSVTDSGPGIPEAKRDEAVKRFVRLEASRSEPGSGLGLALVEAVAEAHHGEFELLDGRGPPERPGLKAVLRLPRAA